MRLGIALAIWVICAIAGYFIARSKGRETWLGVVLGLLLGVIGLLIVALLKPRRGREVAPA